MSKQIKKVESVEDGVNLVLDDDRVIKVTTVDSTNSEDCGLYLLSEANCDDIKSEAENIEDLIKEIEDKYDVELSEEQEEELKESLNTEEEKLDPLKEADEKEDELKESSEEDEEVKAESEEKEEDEPKVESEDEEKKLEEKKKRTESEEKEDDFKLSEELDDLLEVELDDTLKEKIDVAFDTIVKEKVKKIKEELEKDNEEELKESIAVLEKAVSVYIEQAARSYLQENKLAITEGLRNKYFESFFGKLKKLFKENYIELDEKDEELVAELKKENSTLKESTDKLNADIKALNESVVLLKREKEIAKTANEMYLSESDRFKIAAEKLLKESNALSDEKFTQKLAVIAEMFKSSPKKKTVGAKVLSEGTIKVVNENKKEIHPDVSRLLENW